MTDPFSVASGAVGVVSLGLTVCQGLLQYYSSWKGSYEHVAKTCASLEALTKTFRSIETTVKDRKFSQTIVDRVTENIDLCEDGVKELNKKLAKVKKTPINGIEEHVRSQIRRALYPFKESTLLKLRETISDLRENLELAISELQLDASATILQKIDTIDGQMLYLTDSTSDVTAAITEMKIGQKVQCERTRNKDWHAVIRWLSPLQFEDKQRDVLNRRQEGTGSWLLGHSHFRNWIQGLLKTVWCPGIPGAGKTILASTIIEYLEHNAKNPDVAVAYIYCDYKQQNQTALNLIASVVQQLAQQQDTLSIEVSAFHDHHTKSGVTPATPSLSGYSVLLHSLIHSFSKTFIVVDALDECSERDRNVFLDKIQKISPKSHLLVTSRHIPTIEKRFRDAARLEIEAKDEDIKVFLEAWIPQRAPWGYLVKADLHLQERILSSILEKSNGMFLLAVLHTQLLSEEDNKRDLLKALNTLPGELDDTYDRAMQRIEDQSRQRVKRAAQVFSWVAFAQRPLTVNELQCALAVAPGDAFLDADALLDKDWMVSLCAGLVVIDQDVVRLVHYTTQQYFERTREQRYPHAQRYIFTTCVTYLSFDVFAESPCCDLGQGIESQLTKNPLLKYAAQNWGIHARKALDRDPTVEMFIRDFLGRENNMIYSYQLATYRDMFRQRYFVRSSDPCNVSALSVAALFGLEEIVRALLREGQNIDAQDSIGSSALHVAARTEHTNVVQLLLEKGADPTICDKSGRSPLYWAVVGGHESSVRMLLDRESNSKYHSDTAISMIKEAVLEGHTAIVKMLLLHISDVQNRRHCEYAALRVAISRKREALKKLLLESVSMDVRDSSTLSLWHQTAKEGLETELKILLSMGVDIEARDHHGNAALTLAAENGHEGVVRFLLSKGANVNAESSTLARNPGGTALSRAVRTRDVLRPYTRVVRILLDAGAKVETKHQCKTGMTPLNNAVYRTSFGREEKEAIVRMLLEHGASIEIARTDRPNQGRTPLIMIVSEHYNISITRLLLDKGANIEARDSREKTVLHRAVEFYQVDTVQLLLERGADPKSVVPERIGRSRRRYIRDIDKCLSLVREAQRAKTVESSGTLGVDDASIEGEIERLDIGTQAQFTRRWPREKHPDCCGVGCKHRLCASKRSPRAFGKDYSPIVERSRKRRAQALHGRK